MTRCTKARSILTLLSVLISGCCQAGSPCENTSTGPSKGEVIGIAVGAVAASALVAGTVVAVNHGHHTLKGCVSSGPNGLQLANDSDKKTYSLAGASADLKAGEKVKLHGTKQKKQKDGAGNQQFLVDRVTKDFGPCETVASGTAAAQSPAPSR